jgi:putative ABC transport system permease protein
MKNKKFNPPFLCRVIIFLLSAFNKNHMMLDDINEEFREIVRVKGKIKANLWYWKHTLLSIPAYLKNSITWNYTMFKNCLKTTLRNMVRHKGYAFINIAGLALGMTCCILIMIWIQDELSYDKYHENHQQIYRVNRKFIKPDGSIDMYFDQTAYPIGPLLKNDFPEITDSVRLLPDQRALVCVGDRYFEEKHIYFAEPSIFSIFTIKMIKGNHKGALKNPYTAVITEEIARKYFGDKDPLGKSFSVDFDNTEKDIQITGVITSLPHRSHFFPDFLISFSTYEEYIRPYPGVKGWGNNQLYTYIMLEMNHDVKKLEKKLPDFLNRRFKKDASTFTGLGLQKLRDIHLYSQHLDSKIENSGDIKTVYIFSFIALLILTIACINYINLSTARSASRAKEVGMRKVIGAQRIHLFKQFIGESMLVAFIALIVSIIFVMLALPRFCNFLQRDISFNIFGNFYLIIGLIAISLLIGFISGFYPALIFSSFNPVEVFKRDIFKGIRRFSLRKVLVVFQFAVSIILIICVSIIINQLDFIQNKKLGFGAEHVVVLPSNDYMIKNLGSIKSQLKQNPKVVSVSANERIPSGRLCDNSFAYKYDKKNGFTKVGFRISSIQVDHDYIPTLGIQLVAGRNYSREIPSDAQEAFILNERAIKRLGWKSPQEAVGQLFGYGNRRGRIVGVMKDFHFESLHFAISPIVLLISPYELVNISIRIQSLNIPDTLNFLKEKWRKFRPNYPFTYYFVNERFQQLYSSEERIKIIINAFTLMAIFIACLGLFGLASFSAERRTKEIGIRKVIGASICHLIYLTAREFMLLISLASIIAWPVAYSVMREWLENFAYRADIGIGIFILSALIALGVGILIVSYQSIKVATTNPVDVLKHE